jgi:hypothetical protein
MNKKKKKAIVDALNKSLPNSFIENVGPIAYVYTREEAIDDGIQVDVTAAALKVGFHFPVYATSTIYAACVVDFGKILGLREEDSLIEFLGCVLRTLSLINGDRITFRYGVNDDGIIRDQEVIVAHTTQDVYNHIPAIVVMAPGDD